MEKEGLLESYRKPWLRESTPGSRPWASSRDIPSPRVSAQHLPRETSQWPWISKSLNPFPLLLNKNVTCKSSCPYFTNACCVCWGWGVGALFGRWEVDTFFSFFRFWVPQSRGATSRFDTDHEIFFSSLKIYLFITEGQLIFSVNFRCTMTS